jgi:hypothetical protein
MKAKSKFVFLIAFIFSASILSAGDNSQASFADVKEAVYKLIVKNKESIDKTDKVEARVSGMENNYNEIVKLTKRDRDSFDVYIEQFVKKNEQILSSKNNL